MNNNIYKVVIEKLDNQGRGIAFVENKVTFVENSLPGEIVDIKLDLMKKKYNEGTVVNYEKKSADRCNPVCSKFGICGGCDLMHISYNDQLAFKEKKVKDVLIRFSKIDNIETKVNKIVPSKKELNYRNKVTLKVSEKVGYYGKKSNIIVPIDSCFLANEKINSAIDFVNKNLDLEDVSELVIRNVNEQETMLTITLQNDKNLEGFIAKALEKDIFVVKKINEELLITDTKSNIIAKIGSFSYLIAPDAFFQVNLDQTKNLFDKVLEYADLKGTEVVLDLYCGTGTIGLYLSKNCKQVIGIEINPEAIKNAEENAKINNVKNSEFIAIDTNNMADSISEKPDVIVVDPPRSGLTPVVIEEMISMNPNTIIYVSCDPITLARDLSLLSNSYEVASVTPFDMFPNTYHVECVVLLEKLFKE